MRLRIGAKEAGWRRRRTPSRGAGRWTPRVEANPWPSGLRSAPTSLLLVLLAAVAAAAALASSAVVATSRRVGAAGTGGSSRRRGRAAEARAACSSRGAGCKKSTLGGHLGLVRQSELLEDEHIARRRERRQGRRVGDVIRGVGEARVEDELRLRDGVADIAERVGECLHALAVLGNREITLRHRVELVAEEDGALSLVHLEQVLDGDPKIARGLVWFHGEVEDVISDGAE